MKRFAALVALLLVAGCARKQDNAWLGYGEGDYAFVSAPQAGWMTNLAIERGQTVRDGELLFTLDTAEQQASRDQAEATLQQARASLTQEQANFNYMQTELARQNRLMEAHAGTQEAFDQAENNAKQSSARIAQLQSQIGQMEASLSGAAYNLAQRRIVALTEGPVQDIFFRPGEYVPSSTPVISILPPANIYVRFFVPETQLANVRLGQKVKITCDGCKPMEATVTFIASQEEYTPPVIFSVGNREKLVFKVEARAKGGIPVHPGQPVDVRPF